MGVGVKRVELAVRFRCQPLASIEDLDGEGREISKRRVLVREDREESLKYDFVVNH